METYPLTPEIPFEVTLQFLTLATPFEDGTVQLRAKFPRPPRSWGLGWEGASPVEAETLQAFYREQVGGAGTFYYVPSQPVQRPCAAPTMGQSAGGALGARTRYGAFAWADASNETTASVNTGTLAVSSGYLLTVTVPEFPTSVTRAWVYVGATAGALHKQATAITTSGGTWTEPTEGYDAGGAAPQTVNGLTETVVVHFADDGIKWKKVSPMRWQMSCVLEEIL